MDRQQYRFAFVSAGAALLVLGLLGCNSRQPDPEAKPQQVVEMAPPVKDEPDPKIAPMPRVVTPAIAAARFHTDLTALRAEVSALDNEVKVLVNQLAKERVEVNQLKGKVEELTTRQNKEKEVLTARGEAIKNAGDTVTFGTRVLTVEQAKAELAEGVRRFTINQKSLTAHEALLSNRVAVRDALEKQLTALKDQKSALLEAADALETELAMLNFPKRENKGQTDDDRLDKIKEDMRKLKERVAVEREKLKLQPAVDPALPGAKSIDDILAPLNQPTKKP